MADVLIDTNILIYMVDPLEPEKQRRATEVLDDLVNSGKGVLSSQCLSEFFSVATRRLRPLITEEEALENIRVLSQSLPVEPLTVGIILQAAQAVIRHKINFWDAQIWAAAKQHGASEILSEDFTDGRVIEGIRFKNPFVDM